MSGRLRTAARHSQFAERTIAQFCQFRPPAILRETVPRCTVGPFGDAHFGRQEIAPCGTDPGELHRLPAAILFGDRLNPGVVIAQAVSFCLASHRPRRVLLYASNRHTGAGNDMSEAFVQHPGSVDEFAATLLVVDSIRKFAPPPGVRVRIVVPYRR